jgi:histidinol-phosphate/aromatic aminotransferase/cobyric acid decarboxylase-like protein
MSLGEIVERANSDASRLEQRKHLFYETSHSPSLADLVGYEEAKDTIDFCFISNPYYPTPEMLDDLKEIFPNLLKSYPSSNPMVSQKHLAAVLDLKPENLIVGNGATELIVAMNATLIDHIGVPIPTFGEYIEKLRHSRDAELYVLKAEENYQLNLNDYLAWARKHGLRSLLVINPGNPTGQLFSREEMIDFLHRAKDMELVVVDESFIDFAADIVPSLLPVAGQFTNLLLVRSMSKHCGVPGLRLGYCYSENLYLLNRMRQFIPTWNVNSVAQYFLSMLASTDAAYHESRKRLIGDVRWLYNSLEAIPGIVPYPTGANFVLFKIKSGMTAAELQALLLKEHRMYVRDCSNKVGMDKYHIRVASQGREKDGRLVEALGELLR